MELQARLEAAAAAESAQEHAATEPKGAAIKGKHNAERKVSATTWPMLSADTMDICALPETAMVLLLRNPRQYFGPLLKP